MVETLIPADVEAETVAELDTRYTALDVEDLHVGTRIPANEPRPTEFVRIIAVGGSGRDIVADSFTVTLEAFADTESRARYLCALGVAAMQAAGRAGRVGAVPCYGVGLFALPQNLPIPSVPDRYRFTATLSVALRRAAA